MVSNHANIIGKYNPVFNFILHKRFKDYATPLDVNLNNITFKNQNNYKLYINSEPERNIITENYILNKIKV